MPVAVLHTSITSNGQYCTTDCSSCRFDINKIASREREQKSGGIQMSLGVDPRLLPPLYLETFTAAAVGATQGSVTFFSTAVPHNGKQLMDWLTPVWRSGGK